MGVVGGYKSNRDDGEEQLLEDAIGAGYIATRIGRERHFYHEAQLTVMGSSYAGRADRLAVLAKQWADVTSRVTIHSRSEFDIAVAAPEPDDPLTLTNTHTEIVSRVARRLSLKAGLEHEKFPDVPSVRETALEEPRSAFEKGDWRYWVGGIYRLPWRMEFDGEVFLLDPHTDIEYGRGWRTTLRKNGLPLVPAASLSVDVGGVSGCDEPGCSGRVSTRLPLFARSMSLTSSAGFRFLEPGARRSFSMSDVSLTANWRRGVALSMFAAVTYSFGANDVGDNEETVFQVGTQVVW